LVTTSEDFSAVIWNAHTGAPFILQRIEHAAQIAYASFSSDGRWLITAGRDNIARIWDATTGNLLTLPFVHPAKLRRAYFAAGDTAVITRSDNGRTWYWKLPIETKPLADLVDIATFLSARQASYVPPEHYMTNDTFRSSWKKIRDKYPEEFGAR
jgi:WD40 repeat protein